MKQINVIQIAHKLLEEKLNKNLIIVDATCGNGHDTHFLAPKVKHVHAFDIQQQAISKAKQLNKSYTNITYHHTSHENINVVIPHYDGIIFNLGYLPGGDKHITTNYISTLRTLTAIHDRHNGFVLIVAYPGHIAGFIEQVAIQSFLDKNNIAYEVLKLPHITKKEAPIIYYYTY